MQRLVRKLRMKIGPGICEREGSGKRRKEERVARKRGDGDCTEEAELLC